MIRVKTYRKIEPKIISVPVSREKSILGALSRIILYMLRDGKTLADIVEVTLLPREIIEDEVFRLKLQGRLEDEMQEYSDLLTQQKISTADSIKISTSKLKNSVAEIIFDENIPDVSFAARQLNFVPSIGGSIFDDCVELDCTEFFVAEIPVRVYDVADRKIVVELLTGLMPNIDENFLDAVEPAVIRFKPNPAFDECYCDTKILNIIGRSVEIPVKNDGVSCLKAEISVDVVGDYLCE